MTFTWGLSGTGCHLCRKGGLGGEQGAHPPEVAVEVGGERVEDSRQGAGGTRGGTGPWGDGREGAVRAPEGLPTVAPHLAGHPSEDPRFPKVPWPTPDLCPACHQETKGLDSWDEGQVLLFLKRHYGGHNLVHTYAAALGAAGQGTAPAQKAAEHGARGARLPSLRPPRPRLSEGPPRALDGAPGHREAAAAFLGLGFSSLDMSLCVLLYVASSLFLMGMFFFFRVRSKRWKVRQRHPSV